MTRRNTDTHDYKRGQRHNRGERRTLKGRQTALLVMLAILILILIISIVIIAKEISAGSTENNGIPENTSAEISYLPHAEHLPDHAYDKDNSSYMLSAGLQKKGASFAFSLEDAVSIESVGVISKHLSCYIRSAVVQVSADRENWINFGSFSGNADSPAIMQVRGTSPVTGKYIRIVLTGEADAQWAINEISVSTSDGTSAVIVNGSGTEGSSPIDISGGNDTTSSDTDDPKPIEGYTNSVKATSDIHTGDLVLVNSKYKYVFPTSDIDLFDILTHRPYYYDTTKTECPYRVLNGTIKVNSATLEKLNELGLAYYEESGSNCITVTTGYRSYEEQQDLASRFPESAAAAGFSDYHTALSVGLNVTVKGGTDSLDSANGQAVLFWLNANAYKYGFIRRYPEDKDAITGYSVDRFHYRYVGYPHAYYMVKNNLCLEEYLDLIAAYEYSDKHLNFTGDDGKTYEIYFVPASTEANTTVPIPTTGDYTISGDNHSGFIVTITRSGS